MSEHEVQLNFSHPVGSDQYPSPLIIENWGVVQMLLDTSMNSPVILDLPPSSSAFQRQANCLSEIFVASKVRLATILLTTPRFGGTETPDVAERWIAGFEEVQVHQGWGERMMMGLVRYRLVGPAADWFATSRMSHMRWSKFCFHFKARYVDFSRGFEETAIDWERMRQRKQAPCERAHRYAYDKEELCAEIGLNFEYTKKHILVGLRSQKLARALGKRSHDSLEDLLRDLTKYDKVERRRNDRAFRPYLTATGNL